jgi:hypothetical protein
MPKAQLGDRNTPSIAQKVAYNKKREHGGHQELDFAGLRIEKITESTDEVCEPRLRVPRA